MKSKSPLLLSFIWLVAFWVPFSPGCAPKDRYTYSHIKEEYGAHIPPSVQGAERSEAAQPTLPSPLSIPSAIHFALQNSPDLDIAIARIRQSEAIIDEATAAFWPHVSLYTEYVQGDAPSAYLFKKIDQRKLPSGIDFNDPGWFENYETGVQAGVNLFRGGRDMLRVKMAETGLKIHELDRQSVDNALVTSVIHAFYSALAAKDFIQIAEESVRTVETQLRIMKVRYEAGGALKSDVLSLEVRLAQAREDLVRAENNDSLSIAALANLLGLEADTEITLAESAEIPSDLPEHYQAGLVYALAHRPELQKARLQIIQTRMDLDRVRGEYMPTLDAQARYYLDDPSFDYETKRDNWTAGIILNWDLFTGLSTNAGVNKAKTVLEEMLAADRKTTLSVQLDLKTAYLRLAEARARLTVTEASVAQAEESLHLVERQYEGGSATITRYLDAELARNLARIRATAAFHDREKAVAALGRALGYWEEYVRETMREND